MKKNYIIPEINVIQLETLCDGDFKIGSVYRADPKGESVSRFEVVNEDRTKFETEFKDLWGESNSERWGDD